MSGPAPGRVVAALCPDLFFMSKIEATASRLGVRLIALRADLALDDCRRHQPALVVTDLHAPGALEVVRALKADPSTDAIPIVGFYSHVDQAIRAAAEAAGADRVMPRSAFAVRLPEVLAGAL